MRTSSKDFIVKNTNPESKYYTILQYQEFIDDSECYRTDTDCDKVFAKAVKLGMSKNITTTKPDFVVYAVNYNILKIQNGLGGILFGN